MYYEAYFELQEAPFSISPDPRYLYLTQNHREALAHLLYGVSSNGGFVLLTGEIGAGKTTVCQCLLEQLPHNTDVAYILNPKLQPWEFLATICDELGIPYASDDTSLKHYIDLIHHYLLEAHSQGRNTVLMVDEAQNLSTELIEHLRLLTNLETREKKLLQIMLVGQPELRDKIALPEMQQMAQRITARYHLGPLSKSEVAAYVRHRLKVAGATRELFSQDSLNQLWKLTGGVPRLINIICDRSLLGTYTRKGHWVERPVLEEAASEVLGHDIHRSPVRSKSVLWGALALVLAAVAFLSAYYSRDFLPGNQVVSWAVPMKTSEIAESVAEGSEDVVPEVLPEEAPTEAATDIAVVNKSVEPGIEAPPITDQNDEAVPAEAISPPVQVEESKDNEKPGLPEVEAITPEAQFSFPVDLSDAALTESAFGALFRRWKIDYVPSSGVSPCEFALIRQLACAESQGNLPILMKIDR
ncbi:MAG: peptidoglycan-binding protein, partial [Gammaproteobacteria bacterium]